MGDTLQERRDRRSVVVVPSSVPVLPSRLRLPPSREGLIARPRLLDRLVGTGGYPLVAITAPAGYGKTTALSQWMARDDRPSCAILLGPEHDDPAVLITYLAHALSEVIAVDPRVLDLLEVPSDLQQRRALASLATTSREAEPFLLMLDEGQMLQDERCIEIVIAMLDDLPDGAQLVISSRGEPALPYARLRAEGRIVDIGPSDLRFDPSEIADVMLVNGVTILPDAVATLAERTEGWPVAVYLAARADLEGADVRSFTGGDRAMSDYLRSELLGGRSEDVLRFLRRSAILHEMSGPLCDAVLERSESATLLEETERSSLLVIPMDRERHWYRYHHLLREELLEEVGRTEPEVVPELQLRASAWFESEGRVEDAVRYAQEAADLGRVEELVVRHAMRLFATGREHALRPWFDWLMANGSTDQAVAVMCGWLHLLVGHRAEADRCVTIAEAGDAERMLPDGSSVEAWTCTLRGAMALDTASMRAHASRAFDLLAPGSQLRATAMATLGFADYLDGSLSSADRLFADATEIAEPLGAAGASISALGARAVTALDEGRWDDADPLTIDAARIIDRANLGVYPGAALAHAARARIAARAADPDAARDAAALAEELLSFLSPGIAPIGIVTREVLTRAYLELDEAASAARMVQEIEAQRAFWSGFPHCVDALDHLRALVDEARKQTRAGAKLTPAELRIVPWLATQLTFREIAEQLFVSIHTVKAQVTSIYRKLGVVSRTEAVEEARRTGLLSD